MKTKKTIITDWGNTLEEGSDAVRPIDILEKGGCAARYTENGMTKVIYGGNEYVLRKVSELRRSGASIDYFTARIGRQQKQTLKDLKEKGYDTYVYTSGPKEHLQRVADKSGLSNLVKGIISSSDLGQDKKNSDSYRTLADSLGTTPENIIYVDDSKENISAARKAGCNAVLYNGNEFGNLSNYIGGGN